MYYKILNHTESLLQFVAAAAVDDKTAYAVSCNFNGLFRIDLETESCEFVQLFPELEVCKSWLFFSAVKGEKGIYFSPSTADYIARYDIEENKIYQIPLPELERLNEESNYRLGDAFYAHGCVYFVGAISGCILKLEENTGEISVFVSNIQDEVFFRRGILVDDIYYIPSTNSPVIMEYRLQTDEIFIHRIKGEGGAWSIWGDGENFWLPPRTENDPVRCWNKYTEEVSTMEIQVDGYVPADMSFLKIFNNENLLIISPEYANMFLQIDMQNKKIEQFEVACVQDAERYGYYFETVKNLYFAAYVNGKQNIVFKIEKGTLAVRQVQFTLKNRNAFLTAIGTELKKVKHVMEESEANNLEDFIALVQLLPQE